MGQRNDLHTFGYNSAESEPIWMKSGKLWAKCWGLALTDFGRDPSISDSLRGRSGWAGGPPDAFFRFYLTEALQSQTNIEKILHNESR